jgi:predicted nuclease with TOPRIM domain
MTEKWTDETLDRFASATATTTERMESAISELSQAQLRMMQESSEYRRDMTEMRADFREMVNAQTQVLQRIDEMQAEVRGQQTENRRILDHLFGQESN